MGGRCERKSRHGTLSEDGPTGAEGTATLDPDDVTAASATAERLLNRLRT